ncbi:copper oxidase [Corynebacterium sp.]|uniref:copper oxidase n=1 Tax=Corynebacterium sp. TaxID=1720 RepID=UPI0026DBF9B1|nr:copper oxidase [Corynebacterium sp.]MDO5032956.1 copper oxidase [Corynebacterium sp.]
MDKWSARTWHRKASRPVSIWMVVFLIIGLSHILIPNYRWVLIHLFTLGILTNSIMVWSQHLTEKFVQLKLPDSARPRQLRRIYLLNLGIVVVIAGQLFAESWPPHWILTAVGAALVTAMVLWHAAELARLWRQAENKRFRPVVAAYVGSALFLAVGACLGGVLAAFPSQPQLIIAHVAANVGGFVGLAAAGSLTILFPAMWRTQGVNPRMRPSFWLLAAGVVATLLGAIINVPQAGLLLYCVGWALSLQGWVATALRAGTEQPSRLTYPAVSALLANFWLVGGLAYYSVEHFFTPEPKVPMLALVVGFAGQLLIGTMCYLLPTTMGGGPAATRAGLRELNRMGLLRATFVNGGLGLWLITSNSWTMVGASALCLGALAALLPLMIRAVKAQKAVIQGKAEGPAPEAAAPWSQVWAGIAVLALLAAL